MAKKKDAGTVQYPPGFKADCNVTYDGKEGKAKLSIPALIEIMSQIGTRPKIFTMDIELEKVDAPLTNTIWITSDIAEAIEEHMKSAKKNGDGLKKDLPQRTQRKTRATEKR